MNPWFVLKTLPCFNSYMFEQFSTSRQVLEAGLSILPLFDEQSGFAVAEVSSSGGSPSHHGLENSNTV